MRNMMVFQNLCLSLFLLSLSSADAKTTGVTIDWGIANSTAFSSDQLKCLKAFPKGSGLDHSLMIIEGYDSTPPAQCATFNATAINQTISAAKQAGFNNFDVFMIPSPNCKQTATMQVEEMANTLNMKAFGRIWVSARYFKASEWYEDTSANQKFLEELLSAATKYKPAGILTDYAGFQTIMGDKYTGASKYPLWYSYTDNEASFSDFKPFGGWIKPAMKQYRQTVAVSCSMPLTIVGLNYIE